MTQSAEHESITFTAFDREVLIRGGAFETLPRGSAGALSLGALGVAGEAGEVADLIKKHLFHDKPLDDAALLRELGDVLWYLSYLAQATGHTLEEVALANVEKLRKRYPNGFSPEAAAARADEASR